MNRSGLIAGIKLKEIRHHRRTLSMRVVFLKPGTIQSVVLLLITVPEISLKAGGQLEQFTAEEQALVDKGAFIEVYKPSEHSRHFIAHIDALKDGPTGKTRNTPGASQTVVCFVFGIEDADPARKEGRSMAECNYSRSQAHEFLFAQGWDKYHDRFFTRCYVQEGEAAYDQVIKGQQKPVDKSSIRVG